MNNKARGFFGERPLPKFAVDPQVLRRRTRRDVLLFGTGAVAALAGAGFLLPQDTLTRLGVRRKYELSREGVASEQSSCVSTMTWPKRSTRQIGWCPLTPNRRLLRSRTTTTELLPILRISLDGI